MLSHHQTTKGQAPQVHSASDHQPPMGPISHVAVDRAPDKAQVTAHDESVESHSVYLQSDAHAAPKFEGGRLQKDDGGRARHTSPAQTPKLEGALSD